MGTSDFTGFDCYNDNAVKVCVINVKNSGEIYIHLFMTEQISDILCMKQSDYFLKWATSCCVVFWILFNWNV